MNGFEDETFRADQKITREQLAVMLFRVARAENVETSADFTDIADVSDWAVDAVNWAVSTESSAALMTDPQTRR